MSGSIDRNSSDICLNRPIGHCSERLRRRAFTMIETSVSIVLLVACVVMFTELRSTVILLRQRGDIAETAEMELQNIMVLIKDIPDDALLSGKFDLAPLQELVANKLPEGQIKFESVPLTFRGESGKTLPNDGKPDGKTDHKFKTTEVTIPMLRVIISWDNGAGLPRRSLDMVRLK